MNDAPVDRIARAVLYEGYILYPYRRSLKNTHRWTLSGLYPEAYCQARTDGESAICQTECLVKGDAQTAVRAKLRFLHLTMRTVGQIVPPLLTWPSVGEPGFKPVETLIDGPRQFHTWQEGEEREFVAEEFELGGVEEWPRSHTLQVAGRRWLEPVYSVGEQVIGVLVREQQPIQGTITLSAGQLEPGLFKLTLRIHNDTSFEDVPDQGREAALLRAIVSAHIILRVQGGEFVSLLDPPALWCDFAADCQQVGLWPVLVGKEGDRDTMLASPIILYDYPRIAPESPGDFFDGTEIDEMLALRVLALTDDEKHEMAAVDERASDVLRRTESLAREQLLGLHGTMRGLQVDHERGG